MKRLALGFAGRLFLGLLVGACSAPTTAIDASDAGNDVTADASSDIATDQGVDVSTDRGTDVAIDAIACGTSTCSAGQACCASTGTCYDPSCLACCQSGVDASPDSMPPIDTGLDAPSVDVGIGVDVLNDSGGGACGTGAVCGAGLTCCGPSCVNLSNDPRNCGACSHQCAGSTPMCFGSTCTADMCSPACGAGSVCCDLQSAGPSRPPVCLVGTTCPVGCPLCG